MRCPSARPHQHRVLNATARARESPPPFSRADRRCELVGSPRFAAPSRSVGDQPPTGRQKPTDRLRLTSATKSARARSPNRAKKADCGSSTVASHTPRMTIRKLTHRLNFHVHLCAPRLCRTQRKDKRETADDGWFTRFTAPRTSLDRPSQLPIASTIRRTAPTPFGR